MARTVVFSTRAPGVIPGSAEQPRGVGSAFERARARAVALGEQQSAKTPEQALAEVEALFEAPDPVATRRAWTVERRDKSTITALHQMEDRLRSLEAEWHQLRDAAMARLEERGEMRTRVANGRSWLASPPAGTTDQEIAAARVLLVELETALEMAETAMIAAGDLESSTGQLYEVSLRIYERAIRDAQTEGKNVGAFVTS